MSFRLAAFADEAANDLAGQIAAMQENNVDLLEIRGVDGQNIDMLSNEKAREIRRRLDDAGLAVWSLGSPFGKIGIGDDFAPHLDSFRHSLELADILGAKHIRLFSFYGTSDIGPVLERLNAFTEAAKGTGIVLCHENYATTAEAMEELMPWLKEEGWQVVTVSELFAVKEKALMGGTVYTKLS